jgi:ribosomal protein S18 acetylase RimI-like enzyme
MKNKKIKIKKAEIGDIKIIDDFQNGIGEHEKRLDFNIKSQGRIRYYTLKDIEDLIKSKSSVIFIAEIDDKAIGCGFGSIQKNHADWSRYKYKGNIGMMFVEKEFRNQGVGGTILKKLLNWFEEGGVKDVRLQVYQNNDIAVNAYRKAGFKDYILEMIYRP